MPPAEITTHEEHTPNVSHVRTWRELEGRTGGDAIEDEKSTSSQIESKGREEETGKHLPSRHPRFVIAGVLAVLVVALVSIAFVALVGGDHTRRSRPRSGAAHAKEREARKRRPGRARRVREAGGGQPPRQRHAEPRPQRPRRQYRPRHRHRRPAQQPTTSPAQPPESVPAPPEPAPAPSPPLPAAPSEPKEEPGLRDGATESTEFGF